MSTEVTGLDAHDETLYDNVLDFAEYTRRSLCELNRTIVSSSPWGPVQQWGAVSVKHFAVPAITVARWGETPIFEAMADEWMDHRDPPVIDSAQW